MSIVRTIVCDVCGLKNNENEIAGGFPGWCVIQGIGSKERLKDTPEVAEHSQYVLCADHKNEVAKFITKLEEEN